MYRRRFQAAHSKPAREQTGQNGRETLLGVIARLSKDVLEQVEQGEVDDLRKTVRELFSKKLAEISCRQEQFDFVRWREREIVNAAISAGFSVVIVEAELGGPGLLGVSSGVLSAIFDVGVAWDYVLDMPVIPASSLKGAVRSLLINTCATLENTQRRMECIKYTLELLGYAPSTFRVELRQAAALAKLDEQDINLLLKSLSASRNTASAGRIMFYDTYLICGDKNGKYLEPWVITPHYRDAATEYDAQPTPIVHLVLRKGLKGRFIVTLDKTSLPRISRLANVIDERACKESQCLYFLGLLVASALASGVGARTSKGYSSFSAKRILVRY